MLPPELRTYQLLQLGITLSEIDEASAIRLDWLLAIHSIYQKVQDEAAPSAAPQSGSTVTRPLPPPGG